MMETMVVIAEKTELSLDYIIYGNQRQNLGSLYRKPDELNDERKLRTEKVFRAAAIFKMKHGHKLNKPRYRCACVIEVFCINNYGFFGKKQGVLRE